jgi:(1->4)-alpha-D-glucan 1-alpha-D-glucosylmutase
MPTRRFSSKPWPAPARTLSEADWPVLDNLQQWLGGQPWRNARGALAQDAQACLRALPATDLAGRRQSRGRHRFLSLGSVALAQRRGVQYRTVQRAPGRFHAANQQRLQTFPDNLLATATHDHKRGEDSRARLAVLSECAPWYAEQVQRWRRLARPAQ